MAAWSREMLKFCEIFCFFFGITAPYANILKILFWKVSSRDRSNLLFSNVKKICTTVNWWTCALFSGQKTNKISPACPTVATAQIVPKIWKGQPSTLYSECSRCHPNRFTFGGVMAERVNIIKLPRRVNPIFGGSLASSRIITDRPAVARRWGQEVRSYVHYERPLLWCCALWWEKRCYAKWTIPLDSWSFLPWLRLLTPYCWAYDKYHHLGCASIYVTLKLHQRLRSCFITYPDSCYHHQNQSAAETT